LRKFLRSKIHRATVTGADLEYEGSILVDSALLEASNILPYESVHIWNVANGKRFQTYAIAGPRGSGQVVLNGAAARLVHAGDKIIIAPFSWLDEKSIAGHRPSIVFVDEANRIVPGIHN
jgi:aspartate 1-decarboxylase